MKVTISPSKANGHTFAPPSKSMAHRMLMGAGLANGTSIVENIDLSEDIKATLGILEALGGQYKIEDRKVIMQGVGGKRLQTNRKLNSNESGSTLRFFIPLVLTGGSKCEFIGAKRLFERPLGIYDEICREQGILFEKYDTGLTLEGKLHASHFKVQGNISSQFVTGLLFALPLLEGDSVLEVLPPIESRAYIDMTLEALEAFGIEVSREGHTFYIAGNQKYQAKDVTVEGDYSNAAFLDAFNLIGGNVQVDGLLADTLQGDRIYQTYYHVLQEEYPVIDLAECPDLGPILMGMAAAGNGARFTGTRRLRMKESDRGVVMAEELAKFGINRIDEQILTKPKNVLNGKNDHRIVMMLTVMASVYGGIIEGIEAVNKSYPTYYDVIESLGIQVTREF